MVVKLASDVAALFPMARSNSSCCARGVGMPVLSEIDSGSAVRRMGMRSVSRLNSFTERLVIRVTWEGLEDIDKNILSLREKYSWSAF